MYERSWRFGRRGGRPNVVEIGQTPPVPGVTSILPFGGTGVPPVDGQDARPTNSSPRTPIRGPDPGFRLSPGMTEMVASSGVGSLIQQHWHAGLTESVAMVVVDVTLCM
jgi:hypothetical protein